MELFLQLQLSSSKQLFLIFRRQGLQDLQDQDTIILLLGDNDTTTRGQSVSSYCNNIVIIVIRVFLTITTNMR